jgi:hypothetical protein
LVSLGKAKCIYRRSVLLSWKLSVVSGLRPVPSESTGWI